MSPGKGPPQSAGNCRFHSVPRISKQQRGTLIAAKSMLPPITVISIAHKGHATADCEISHVEVNTVSIAVSSEELDQHKDAFAIRLQVLELVVATIAARLPKEDVEEVVSVLVFVANASDAASTLGAFADPTRSALAQHYATEMLQRMTKVRRRKRRPRFPN
ncbi:hypothetical protein [Roseomonas sp. KE2513]|uniref:hypothetical protein n=1 Tax=Roseomonas sp. KE2513 TaxID=2479202 RepID=UPI0018E00D03|nr:hypothetical protein [Roseomonas sp. KE2513]